MANFTNLLDEIPSTPRPRAPSGQFRGGPTVTGGTRPRPNDPSSRNFRPRIIAGRFGRRDEDTGTHAFIRNIPRAVGMGLANSQAFTQAAGAGAVGSMSRNYYGDDDAMGRVRAGMELNERVSGIGDKDSRDLDAAVQRERAVGRMPELPDFVEQKAAEWRRSPDFNPKRHRKAHEEMIRDADKKATLALQFGEAVSNKEGFFRDLGQAHEDFYGQIDDLTGGELQYSDEDLAKMSRGHRKALGWAQTMGELVGPSRVVQAGLGSAKLVAKGFREGIGASLAGVPAGVGRAVGGQMRLPMLGMTGGAGVGAAYSGDEEAADDHAGQVADAAEKAAWGSLSGMVHGMTAGWAGRTIKGGVRAVRQAKDEQAHELGQMMVSETYGDDLAAAVKLAEKTGMHDVPVPLLTKANAPIGASARSFAAKLGAEQQKDYSDQVVKAQHALAERYEQFKGSIRVGDAPEMKGKIGKRTVNEKDENAWAVMKHLNKRARDIEREHAIRYRDMTKEFDKHRVSYVRMADDEGEHRVYADEVRAAMKDLDSDIEKASKSGTQVEASQRASMLGSAGRMTTRAADLGGGLRRFEKSLKELEEAGKIGEGGVSARVLTEFVHNANEILERAEQTGKRNLIREALLIKDTAYGMLRGAAEQGLLPKALVKDFIDLQGERKVFHQLFGGDDKIAMALRDMSKKTHLQDAYSFREGFISKSGKVNHADIRALYGAVGKEGRAAVDEFLADTIWDRIGGNPDKMYRFYDQNSALLADPLYAGLRLNSDRVLFESIGMKVGDKGVLDFVSKAKDDQIGHFVRVAKAHGGKTYSHIGHRILDEIATKPAAQRAKFLNKHGDKLWQVFEDPAMAKKLDTLYAFTAVESAVGSHTKYKEVVAGNMLSWLGRKGENLLKRSTGMTIMTATSVSRAMMRHIISPTVAFAGMAGPKAAAWWADHARYKYLMTTFAQKATRRPNDFARLVDDLIADDLSAESTQFLRTIAAAANEGYQPARFTREMTEE